MIKQTKCRGKSLFDFLFKYVIHWFNFWYSRTFRLLQVYRSTGDFETDVRLRCKILFEKIFSLWMYMETTLFITPQLINLYSAVCQLLLIYCFYLVIIRAYLRVVIGFMKLFFKIFYQFLSTFTMKLNFKIKNVQN